MQSHDQQKWIYIYIFPQNHSSTSRVNLVWPASSVSDRVSDKPCSHLDSFTVPLHNPIGRQMLGLCKVTASGLWKQWKFRHVSPSYTDYPRYKSRSRCLPVYIGQSHSRQHLLMGGHVSYPTDCPTAAKLGLGNSLAATQLLGLLL